MPDFINLTCPKCGRKLQITNDIDRFSCGYCDNELIVRRSGRAITIAPVIGGLKQIKMGVDKTASELAIVRLQKEIDDLSEQRDEAARIPGCFQFLLFVLIILFVFGLIIGFRNGFGSATLLLSVTIILGIIGYVFYYYSMKGIQRRVLSIDQILAEKRRELEKHRNIVRNV